jgi:hypothetical protein
MPCKTRLLGQLDWIVRALLDLLKASSRKAYDGSIRALHILVHNFRRTKVRENTTIHCELCVRDTQANSAAETRR